MRRSHIETTNECNLDVYSRGIAQEHPTHDDDYDDEVPMFEPDDVTDVDIDAVVEERKS